ncbi:D-glycerate dehydrogenase [Sulfitobacter sp. D35]|uniref:2-hydroxyacid dehydrogenase n=1 Tax=Sulfitobacter sp. D35 TaxID=3083252 RepID=UPI00296F009F|nr:D-glycerate dehydrogenase [Sulfitobacter sp. D35]MDW4497346.1 D-glycerate dehydrogenase [Sulfitobacter sp. D35]
MTRPLPQEVQDEAAKHFDVTVRENTAPMNSDELRAGLRDYDGVIPTLGDLYTPQVFDDVPDPRCRILANFGVGYNHIDVTAATAAGLVVTNTPGAVTEATADTAMTLILMSCRRAGEGERLVRAGEWEGWHPTQLLGLHLGGRTVGIVGMGRIGQAIARRCHSGFGMKVAYHSRSPKTLDFPAERKESLSDLARAVDVMVVAVPGGDETHHLVDAKVLAAMQPHAHLVNIARGNVVDEAALIAALEQRRIGGAGLDVYEFEPKVPQALKALENVVLLPHIGTAALEVRTEMGLMSVENLRAFFAGEAVPNPV